MKPTIVDERVEARIHRQHLLEKESKSRARALLDEAVLRRQVGVPPMMHAQLDKIFKCAAEDKVTVQVIPFDVGAHASTDSNFVLLEFDEIYHSGRWSSSKDRSAIYTKSARPRSSDTAKPSSTCAMPRSARGTPSA